MKNQGVGRCRPHADNFPPRPHFYSMHTADDIPYWKLAQLHSHDVLATTVLQTCVRYGNADTKCQFCAIGESLKGDRTIARKTPEQRNGHLLHRPALAIHLGQRSVLRCRAERGLLGELHRSQAQERQLHRQHGAEHVGRWLHELSSYISPSWHATCNLSPRHAIRSLPSVSSA